MAEEKARNFGGMTPEQYQGRLLNKLNCLIAVLEVAISKINQSIKISNANPEKLEKIRNNLENTLAICKRAKETLEKRMKGKNREVKQGSSCSFARGEKERENKEKRIPDGKMTYRDYVELSSIKEYQKFKKLPPIKMKDVKNTDIEALIRKLLAG